MITKLLTNTLAIVLGAGSKKAEQKPEAQPVALMSEPERLRALLRSTIPILVRQEVTHHIAAITAQARGDTNTMTFERVAAGRCRATIDKIVSELK